MQPPPCKRKSKALEVYDKFLRHSVPTSAQPLSGSHILITRTQSDPGSGKERRTYQCHGAGAWGVPVSEATIWTRDVVNDRIVMVVTHKEGSEENKYIEVWSLSGTLLKSIRIPKNLHGDIYGPNHSIGNLALHGSSIAYVAEHAIDKERKDYAWEQDFGEQYTGKRLPVLVVLGDVEDVEEEPENDAFGVFDLRDKEGLAVVSPVFLDASTVVFQGIKTSPRVYGHIYCVNRQTGIYTIHIPSRTLTRISDEAYSARSPRVVNGKILYLQNPTSGPHFSSAALIYDGNVIIPRVERPATPDGFCGLYISDLPFRDFCTKSSWVFMSSQERFRSIVLAVNLETGEMVRYGTKDQSSVEFLCVWGEGGKVVARAGDIKRVGHVVVADIALEQSDPLTWEPLEDERAPLEHHLDKFTYSINKLSDWNEILIALPETSLVSATSKCPVILWPHGGPHSAFTGTHSTYASSFLALGYAIVQVNYTGSTGYGDASIEALVGKVGTQDVHDCMQGLDYALKAHSDKLDEHRVVVFGGSHGGFLGAWLSAQYPDRFKAAILRNPVTDLTNVYAGSDIPDWALSECGLSYSLAKPPTLSPESYGLLFKCSPVSMVDRVKCRTLLMLGADDRRVPTYQGINWGTALKARGVDVRVRWYDGVGHALDKVEVLRRGFEECVAWLEGSW